VSPDPAEICVPVHLNLGTIWTHYEICWLLVVHAIISGPALKILIHGMLVFQRAVQISHFHHMDRAPVYFRCISIRGAIIFFIVEFRMFVLKYKKF